MFIPTIEQDTSCTLTRAQELEGTPGSCSSGGALSVPDLCSDLQFFCCSLQSETSLYRAYKVFFEPTTWIWTFCVAILNVFRILLLSVIFLLCFLYLNCCVLLLCMTKSCLLHLLKVYFSWEGAYYRSWQVFSHSGLIQQWAVQQGWLSRPRVFKLVERKQWNIRTVEE